MGQRKIFQVNFLGRKYAGMIVLCTLQKCVPYLIHVYTEMVYRTMYKSGFQKVYTIKFKIKFDVL